MNVREIPCRDLKKVLQKPWVDISRRPWISGDTAYVPVREGYPYTQALPERRRKGRGYQKIGSIIAFHGEKPDEEVISDIINRHNPETVIGPGARVMLIPDINVLMGDSDTFTRSGILYHLTLHRDVSQGKWKRKRVAGLVKQGEDL